MARGFLNYYSFADNISRLSKIYWVLKESLRKTLSRKLDINKLEFQRNFGKNITVTAKGKKIRKVSFYKPKMTRSPMRFMSKEVNWDPLRALDWRVSTRDSFDTKCAVCESPDNIEMHHIKHIKTINLKLSSFDTAVAKINRKQVPLCTSCHSKVHKGEYKGNNLKTLK